MSETEPGEVTFTLPGIPDVRLAGRVTHVVPDGLWVTCMGGEIKIGRDQLVAAQDSTSEEQQR